MEAYPLVRKDYGLLLLCRCVCVSDGDEKGFRRDCFYFYFRIAGIYRNFLRNTQIYSFLFEHFLICIKI